MAKLSIYNPVVYAFHRRKIAEFRGLLHPEANPVTVEGEMRVARTPIEVIADIRTGSAMVIIEDGPADRTEIDDLKTIVSDLDQLAMAAGKREEEDPNEFDQIYELADRMLVKLTSIHGYGLTRLLRHYPFKNKKLQTVPILGVTELYGEKVATLLNAYGADALIQPGQSRQQQLNGLATAARLSHERGFMDKSSAIARTARPRQDRADRMVREVLALNPNVVIQVLNGEGNRPDDLGFPMVDVLKFLRINYRDVTLMRRGGIILPDGSVLTKDRVWAHFKRIPNSGELTNEIQAGRLRD